MSERINLRALFRRARRASLSLVLAAFVLTAGLAVSAWAFLSARPGANAPGSGTERIEATVITVRPNGFEPAEITRPKGRFILAVNNRTLSTDLELQLERENGNHVREVKVHRNRPNWREVVDLPPGQYVLREASHPDWACRITITAQ
jgi:uncharacterized protein (DUF58 family)